MKSSRFIATGVLLSLALARSADAVPLGSSISYQGHLKDGGSPASGPHSMTFTLWDQVASGSQIGPTLTFDGQGGNPPPVSVTNGLFTVQLDFGAAAFNGERRWLNIAVNGTPLAPRQELTASPHTLHSRETRGISVDATGRVGIGTTLPGAQLDVRSSAGGLTGVGVFSGNLAPFGFARFESNSSEATTHLFLAENGVGKFSVTAGGATNVAGKLAVGGPAGNDGNINASANGFYSWNGAGRSLRVSTDGAFNDIQSSGAPLSLNQTSLQDIYLCVSGGNVGIGIGPTAKLHVNGSTKIQGQNTVEFGAGVPGKELSAGKIGYQAFSTGLDIVGAGVNGTDRRITLWAEGGCTIQGACSMTKAIIFGGADVAENYDVAAGRGTDSAIVEPRPGMVVVIDPREVGKLIVATVAYDRRVAGVISGADGVRPGLILGQKDSVADGEHPVANVGRVWCWCDADAGGAVEPGDLLVTSDTPGHAMRADSFTRSQGAVLGKAMSRLEKGRGLVLLLVSLQ